jgi:hypothetical protein
MNNNPALRVIEIQLLRFLEIHAIANHKELRLRVAQTQLHLNYDKLY